MCPHFLRHGGVDIFGSEKGWKVHVRRPTDGHGQADDNTPLYEEKILKGGPSNKLGFARYRSRGGVPRGFRSFQGWRLLKCFLPPPVYSIKNQPGRFLGQGSHWKAYLDYRPRALAYFRDCFLEHGARVSFIPSAGLRDAASAFHRPGADKHQSTGCRSPAVLAIRCACEGAREDPHDSMA